MKLLKDIRDSLRVGARPPRPDDNNGDNNDGPNNDYYDDDNNDDDRPDYNNMPDLETEEELVKRIADNYDDIIKNLKDKTELRFRDKT